MNKKAQGGWGKVGNILLIIAAVLTLLMIFYGPEKTFSKITDITKSIKDTVRVGQPDVKPIEITAPHNVELAFDRLNALFKEYSTVPKTRCLITYKEFAKFENDCRISLERVEESKLRMEIQCPDEFGVPRVVKTNEKEARPGIWPCVVAGKFKDYQGNIVVPADNFFSNWIDKKKPEKYPERTQYEYISITDETTISGFDLNDNGLEKDGEEISYLYKADAKSICFFASNNVKNHDEDGIDDDYVHDMAKYVPFCK